MIGSKALYLTALSLTGLIACGGNIGDGDCADDDPICIPKVCDSGDTQACYTGAAGTEGVGRCAGGTQECLPSREGFGPCEGETTPTFEVCANTVDDDCNGVVDDDPDDDGDGFTACLGGDCCDNVNAGCTRPDLVNPGAFEVAGNNLDDDCDGTIDNPVAASCDMGLASNSGTAMDYAFAMDLCKTATEAGTEWGIISAEFTLTDGSGTPNGNARSIRPAFGAAMPQFGSSLAVLSSGHAAAVGQSNPSYAAFQGGTDLGRTSAFPADWLSANGGNVPNVAGCPPPAGAGATDPIMLKLRIRVPTNANSFSVSSNFLSSEYPEWVCSPYNDFFILLLDSTFAGTPANPTDKNLAIYTDPAMMEYPVGVNLAFGNTGLFQECLNGPTGCAPPSVAGTTTACTGTAGLTGTGMDITNPGPQFSNDPGYCGASNLSGGGTGWLSTSGNIVPGEIIELRFAIWDTSDPWYDSVVLLDNFQWSVDGGDPGTVID